MLIVLGRRWVVWQAEAALLRQFFLLSKNPPGPGIRTSNDGPRPRAPLRSFPAHPMFYQTQHFAEPNYTHWYCCLWLTRPLSEPGEEFVVGEALVPRRVLLVCAVPLFNINIFM